MDDLTIGQVAVRADVHKETIRYYQRLGLLPRPPLRRGEIRRYSAEFFDRVRFIKPVFIGDTIHVEVTIGEKRDDPKRPGHGFVEERCVALNQRGEAVLAFTHLHLVERK